MDQTSSLAQCNRQRDEVVSGTPSEGLFSDDCASDLRGKTVLIPLRYGLVARNILRGDFINALHRAGIRVVAVCPAAREQYLIDELASYEVVLEPYPARRSSAGERVWRNVTNALTFDNPAVTATMRLKWLEYGLERRSYGKFLGSAVAALLQMHRVKSFDSFCSKIDKKLFQYEEISALFRRYRPDLVLATNLFGSDNDFIAQAKREGIPTVGIVKSWDNLTSKTRIRVKPDKLLVWSRFMANEAAQIHHFDEKDITVVGAPQFDIYRKYRPRLSREEFCRIHGIDPEKKIILYSPGVKFTFSDIENVRLIHQIVNSPSFPVACHIHVRKYPKKQQDYTLLESQLGITTESAGRVVSAWDDGVDQSEDELRYLSELIANCDVMVQFGSTIAIDAFCHDVPVIGYDLDRNHERYRWYSYVSRAHDCTHNKYIVDAGAVRVVRTQMQLAEALRQYLLNPSLDSPSRRAILNKIIGELDGQSGRRIAKAAIETLAESRRENCDSVLA